MSDGCHANTSTFARRKATSALSYLLSSVALMVKVPPVPSSLADTFLVAGGAAIPFLHLPVEWNVLDGGAALRRGAVAGVGPRALAGLGPCLLPPGSFSGKRILFCRSRCIPVDLVGADKRVLLVTVGGDDAYRPRHLEYVVGVVGSCHELGEGGTAEYPIVWQWDIGDVERDALSSEVELPAKGHR